MDTLYINGIIRTMDGANTVVDALGISDGIITFLGTNEEALAKTAEAVIDLKGALMLPGFCDTHMHLVNDAFVKSSLQLFDVHSKRDILSMLKKYRAENEDLSYIYGRGFNEKDFEDKSLPDKYELDDVCHDLPVVLARVCGHMAVCNARALDMIKSQLGYEREKQAGCIDEENGRLYEGALQLFFSRLPAPSAAYVKRLVKSAMSELNRCGITSVQTDDFGALPGGSPELMIEAYEQLEASGEMTVRVYEQCLFSDNLVFSDFLAKGFVTGRGGDYFKIGPLKMLQDGSLGARTAALKNDYCGSEGNCGILNFSQETLNEAISLANSHNMQAAIHGIGDRAIESILTAIENGGEEYARKLRHGIVHAQITNSDILKRMRNLELVAYIQPVFLESDMHIAESRLGTERTNTSYAFKTMLDMGIVASGGSDAPVCPFDVLENIYHAVTRTDSSGFPDGGWLPDERMTVEQAVRLFTSNASYCSFSEPLRGSLELGKQADLAVLDRDIFTTEPETIREASILRTVSGGKTVFKA